MLWLGPCPGPGLSADCECSALPSGARNEVQMGLMCSLTRQLWGINRDKAEQRRTEQKYGTQAPWPASGTSRSAWSLLCPLRQTEQSWGGWIWTEANNFDMHCPCTSLVLTMLSPSACSYSQIFSPIRDGKKGSKVKILKLHLDLCP
jgi:hypothetical protein